ncbi:MAG: autotransporter domain-containing protein [Chlamydiales bacterium]|nr:autotransporter domain-containing protein [Chlamydiales bacterium]
MFKFRHWIFATTFVSTSSLVASLWNGSSDQFWNTSGNWNSGVPNAGEGALFTGSTPNNAIEIDVVASAADLSFGGSFSYSLTPTAPGNTLTIVDDTIQLNGGQPQTINATIIPGTSGALTISGTSAADNVILGGDNSGITGVTINIGKLSASSANNICATNGQINLANSLGTLHATSSFTLPQPIVLLATSPNIEVDAGQTLTISNVISESGGTNRIDKDGTGTLVLNATNTFTNGVHILNGTLEISSDANLGGAAAGLGIGSGGSMGTLRSTGTFTTTREFTIGDSGATIDIAAGQTLTEEGNIVQGEGPVPLIKTGDGSFYINGPSNTYNGLTTVQAGYLSLNSTILGDVQVDAGGRLGGNNGEMRDLTVDGTVAPGNSIGTLFVNGNYQQNAGGNFELEINAAGQNDILSVTGTGSITGSLTVLPEPGLYSVGMTYDFLLTQGGLTGQFTSLLETSPLVFGVNYLPLGNITFAQLEILGTTAIVPVPTDDLTGNPRRVAEYLFCPEEVNTSSADFVAALSALLSQTPDNYKKALINLSPAQYGALPLQNLNKDVAVSTTLVERIEQHMWCDRCDSPSGQKPGACQGETRRTSIWGTILGQWQRQDGIQEQYGFHDQTYGFNLGASHLFTNHLFLTGGIGYTYSDLSWKNHKGSADTNALYIAPSIGYAQKNYFVNFLGLFAANWNSVDRNIEFPGLSRTAHSHFNSYDLLFRLDGGYKFMINDSNREQGPFLFVPEARLSYLNVWQGSFSESGAGSLNLKVKSKRSSFLQPEFLVKILKEYYVGESCVIPLIKAGYVAKVPVSSSTYNYSATLDVIDCSSDLTVKTFDWTSNQLMLGAGLLYKTLEHVSAGFDYEAHMFDKSLVQTAKINFDWKF